MATKQAQKQDSITDQQSKTLIKNMIRISVSSICYHRDIFPPECFVFKPYGNMEIVQLDAAIIGESGDIVVKDPKAFILTQWLEKGVFKVLEDNHLASMTFAVYTKHPITQEDLLLEAYEFKFTFIDGKAQINGVSVKSKEDIKSQAGKFVRNLVLFASSLDELPNENWITIEIKYDQSVSDDYEPEYFKTVNKSSLSFPGSDALRVKLGKIETPFLTTEAKFLGLESLLYENLCKVGQPNAPEAVPEPKSANIFKASVSKPASEVDEDQVASKMDSLSVDNKEDSDDEKDDYKSKLNQVRTYVLNCGKCFTRDISLDCNIRNEAVKQIMQDLVKEKIISRSGNRYTVNIDVVRDHVGAKESKAVKDQHIEADSSKEALPPPAPPAQTVFAAPSSKPTAVIEDIEEVPTPGKRSKHQADKKPITYSRNTLKIQSNNTEVDLKPVDKPANVIPESLNIPLSQASDFSQSPALLKGKKRMYGTIKDPIEVNRHWNKKPKLEKVVSQA